MLKPCHNFLLQLEVFLSKKLVICVILSFINLQALDLECLSKKSGSNLQSNLIFLPHLHMTWNSSMIFLTDECRRSWVFSHNFHTRCGTNNMISNILFYQFYPIYIIPVINVQKNTPKFHTTYFYNTHFYIPVISALPCFYIPVSQKKCQFIPTFVNTSSNIIVRGPSTFVEFLETLDYKLNVPIIRKITHYIQNFVYSKRY